MFFQLIVMLVLVVLTELLRPKPNIEDARPAALGDFQLPTATEGRVVPLLWGKVRLKGPNVVWYGDLTQETRTQKVKTGLWSSTRVVLGFKYYLGVQLAICRGPDVILRKIWVGDDLVYTGTLSAEGRIDIDEPNLFGGDKLGQGGLAASVDFYPGNDTQTINAYLDDTARQRISAATPTCPRYTGTSHLVIRQHTEDAPAASDTGAYVGNATRIKEWSFEVERYPALFSGQTSGHNRVGSDGDANPINVIYELLTNTEWGFGFAAASVDVGAGSTFLAASNTVRTEGNGIAFVADRAMKASALLAEITRQIDGAVFLDHLTAKWRIKMVRYDYTIGSVPQLTDSNVSKLSDFVRSSWEDTTNQVQVKFSQRSDEYKESYAVAQDMANAIVRSSGDTANPAVSGAIANYPGVKNSELASVIAWRDLRVQSYPLARASLTVNRQMYDLRIGDVVAFTNTGLGLVQLPMRVGRINYGTLQDNVMTLELVQDVFRYAAASMGTPPPTGWAPPSTVLAAFQATQQLAMECPRAIQVRDPSYNGDFTVAKVFCSARQQGTAVAYQIGQRNASGTPGGSYAASGDVFAFMLIGQLTSTLSPGTAIPTAAINITATPDSQTNLEAAFEDERSIADLGASLSQLILVGSEFMSVQSAADSAGTTVNLQNVYRGVLDSVQATHAASSNVYLLFQGSGVATSTFTNTYNVDIELRPQSAAQVFTGTVTAISLTMDKRAVRPYPPAAFLYNGSATPYGSINVDGDGSGLNGSGFNTAWRRRDYRTANEVEALLSDDSGVDASTEYELKVVVAPSGSADLAFDGGWVTGAGPTLVNRLALWEHAAAGTAIQIQMRSRHDLGSETNLTSRYTQTQTVTPTSAYDGLFYLGGGLTAGVATATFIASSTGTHTVEIGAAYSSSVIESSHNGAAFITLVSAGSTSATISLGSSDTLVLRQTVNEVPSPNLIQIKDPSAVIQAYGVLTSS